jgi:hypothetical protein
MGFAVGVRRILLSFLETEGCAPPRHVGAWKRGSRKMFEHGSRGGWVSRFMVCALLGLSLSACGGGGETKPDANTTAPDPAPAAPAPPPSATNTPPVIEGDPALNIKAGETYTFAPQSSDADNEGLSFTITGLPAWASFNQANGTLAGTPQEAHVGQTEDIEITVSDGTDTDSIGPFRIEVTSGTAPPPTTPNNAPKISGTPAGTVQATQPYIFVPTASDADGDKLTFAIANRPQWAAFNTSTGQLSGTPSRTQTATVSNIRISVSDGKSTATLAAFAIRVTPAPNGAPSIAGTPATTASIGAAYTFAPTASDLDSNTTLTWSIQNRPTWAQFSVTTGRLTGTPTAAGTTSNIRISVSDGSLSAALPAFNIVVSASANKAPTITGNPPTTATIGAAYSFRANGADADGNALTYSINKTPAWATFNTANGTLSGTPAAGNAGTTSDIVISVSDGKGGTASLAAFSITVAAAQTATGRATLSWTPPTRNTDGSTLQNLAGHRIYYGTSSTSLTRVVTINTEGVTSYTVENLTSGTWYFSVRAYTDSGEESTNSNVASKTIQ